MRSQFQYQCECLAQNARKLAELLDAYAQDATPVFEDDENIDTHFAAMVVSFTEISDQLADPE